MEQRWHIRFDNGVSKCKARPGECRYASEDEHYGSFEEVLKAFKRKLDQHPSLREKRKNKKTIKRYEDIRKDIDYILFHMKELGGYLARDKFTISQQAIMTHMMQKANQRLPDEDFYYLACGEIEPNNHIIEELETTYQTNPDLWANVNDKYWLKHSHDIEQLHERIMKRVEKGKTLAPPKIINYEQKIDGVSPLGNLGELSDGALKSYYGDEYSHHLALTIFDKNEKRYRVWATTSSLDFDGDDTGEPEIVHFFAEDTKKNVFIDVYGSFDSPRAVMGDWEDFRNDPTLKFVRYADRGQMLELFEDFADFYENYDYDANYVIERFRLI